MALWKLRRTENIEGEFFVDSTCIDCDLCRQIAPLSFSRAGEQSIVHKQPETSLEELDAMKALVTCPTASIGAVGNHPAKAAISAYPEKIEEQVYFCGFAAESSFGASSYLVVRPQGNVLIDSPRFADPLVRNIEKLGGASWMFLTHRDDIADHEKWAAHFGAERIMHGDDLGRTQNHLERTLNGHDPVRLDAHMIAIPTPGHTRGHTVLLYRNRYLFGGDHLRWSENFQSLYASPYVCWYSWPQQIRSMEHLLDYRFEWVLPGHGRRVHADPDKMTRFLRECIDRMKAPDSQKV